MVPSIVVCSTYLQNIKMRSSELIIKKIAQKVMENFSFGHKFHDLKCFEVGFSFHIP